MFFASSQNNKLLFGESPTSPRASRKFSSPPPLAITKNSSPNRRRKLSLNIPIITGGKALDLAALSCSSNGYASMYSSMSPFSKTTLDINKLYMSSPITSKIQDEGEGDKKERAEDSAVSKQGGFSKELLPNQQIPPTSRANVPNEPCHFIPPQISRCGRRATTTRTRAMRVNRRLRPPSRRPPRKTSSAKTLQVRHARCSAHEPSICETTMPSEHRGGLRQVPHPREGKRTVSERASTACRINW